MSFPRYESYKDSGVEWLGEVPEHWGLPRLKHFTSFFGGGTPSRDNLQYWNGDIPWISPKDMKSESINSSEELITATGLENSSSSLMPSGRILMVVRSGILKHTVPVAINEVPVALNQDMKALEFKSVQCVAKFFLRWVQGLNDLLLLSWAKQGATVESIEHAYLAETIVPLPPINEQQTIAAFLDRETAKIDALIAEQQRLIELLKEKRQAVISHAVTKGLNPNAPMKDSGIEWLGEVPAHWEVRPIKFVISKIDSGTSVNATDEPAQDYELGVLKTSCVYTGVFDPTENKTVVEQELDRVSCPLRADTLIVSRMNTPDLVGASGLVTTAPKNIYLPDRLWQISFQDTCTAFIYYWTQTPIYRAYIKSVCAGTSSSMQNLSQDQFRSFILVLPSIEEQAQIAEFIENETYKLDTLTAEAKRGIELLQERRTALISAAVTGKIDVRGLVSTALPEEADA